MDLAQIISNARDNRSIHHLRDKKSAVTRSLSCQMLSCTAPRIRSVHFAAADANASAVSSDNVHCLETDLNASAGSGDSVDLLRADAKASAVSGYSVHLLRADANASAVFGI